MSNVAICTPDFDPKRKAERLAAGFAALSRCLAKHREKRELAERERNRPDPYADGLPADSRIEWE